MNRNSFFFIMSVTIIFSPAVYPLANPFSNPNTQFKDYPVPLQEAFAESQVGTIERGTSWSTEIIAVNSTGITKKHIFGLPEFILVNGKYINAKVTEDKDFVYVDARTSVKISKLTCELIELEKGRYIDNLAVRKITDYTILTSDDAITWNDDLDAKICNSVTSVTNSIGTFVTAKQTIGRHELEIVYVWYERQELVESFLTPTNNDVAKYIAVQESQRYILQHNYLSVLE